MAHSDHEGSAYRATTLVNGRAVTFDLGSGEILEGPPKMVGKFITESQKVELVASPTNWQGHLHLAESEADLRLAEIESDLASRRAEEVMSQIAKGNVVDFRESQWTVSAVNPDGSVILAPAVGDGDEINVPHTRVHQITPSTSVREASEYASPVKRSSESVGEVDFDEEDLIPVVSRIVKRIIMSPSFLKAVAVHMEQMRESSTKNDESSGAE